jgi:phosphoenolpyruvate phosphomutase
MKKTRQFRNLLESKGVEFLMEAHSGLSGRIAEEAGFKGIWGSGLSISASKGVRDSNELSWTQVLDEAGYISDATSVPMMLDADTGYGNFNNVRRLVRKLEQVGVAAVCIEDKVFPKTNSLLKGAPQPLADVDEFAGKIRAAKDTQADPDFAVVARIEGFIAGFGLDECLKRATAYREAGADAVLIHSAKDHPEEILSFLKAWNNACPVVIVPTKYYKTPTSVFEEAGVSLVIWANHLIRSSVTAMRDTAVRIMNDRSLVQVEPKIAPVDELFRLTGTPELSEAEKKYLPVRR